MAPVGFISQWVTACLQVGCCFDWNQSWHPLASLGLFWSLVPQFPYWRWVGGARVSESSLCVAWDWLLMLALGSQCWAPVGS